MVGFGLWIVFGMLGLVVWGCRRGRGRRGVGVVVGVVGVRCGMMGSCFCGRRGCFSRGLGGVSTNG